MGLFTPGFTSTRNILQFDDDSTFDPAAPFIEIEIDGYHHSQEKRSLRAMVDSGADATMIPISVLEAVGTGYQESLWLRGTAGGRSVTK